MFWLTPDWRWWLAGPGSDSRLLGSRPAGEPPPSSAHIWPFNNRIHTVGPNFTRTQTGRTEFMSELDCETGVVCPCTHFSFVPMYGQKETCSACQSQSNLIKVPFISIHLAFYFTLVRIKVSCLSLSPYLPPLYLCHTCLTSPVSPVSPVSPIIRILIIF